MAFPALAQRRSLVNSGVLDASTDRHQHNIVFFAERSILRLAPAFDQVSMLYSPSADGQVPSRTFTLPYATSDTLDVWDEARLTARQFWERASDDARLSNDVRSLCATNAKLLVN